MSSTIARWAVLLGLLSVGAAMSLAIGRGDLGDPELRATFLKLRALRCINAALAGAALGTAGALVQGLFRNPLASPSIIGTSAGASLGGVAALVLWDSTLAAHLSGTVPPELFLPIGCVVGAGLSLLVLLSVVGPGSSSVRVLLTGFILSSLFLSMAGFLTSLSQESFELGRSVVAFTLGGVDAKGVRHAALAAPMVLAGAVAAWGWGRHLDLLLSGEDEAKSLGVSIVRVRRWAVVWTAVLTAAAVAIGGNVSFVGLIVPHALRPFFGVTHRALIPAAFVGGAAFLVWADVLARLAPTRAQLPLGVVTGLIGAPLFLILIARSSREASE